MNIVRTNFNMNRFYSDRNKTPRTKTKDSIFAKSKTKQIFLQQLKPKHLIYIQ